ncbi:MAG TPA: hypothetical protein VMY05_09115 [Acidobacteriota bacterium]|nr:hypothetical protein [Acidobacteriota bacterium]
MATVVRHTFAARLAVLAFPLVVAALLVACQSESAPDEAEMTLRKQLAGELRDNKLFEAAIEEYRAILQFKGVPPRQMANINYLIARIYFEDLKDYPKAASYYMRARALDPEGSFMAEASQNLVASLQKMGNVVDARRELAAAADVDGQPRSPDDVPVARIGEEPVWRSEVERAIQTLPPELQERILTPEAKVEFVRQYVGVELLYRAAARENYLSHPEIVRQQEQVVRKLVVDKYLVDKVIPQISIDTLDVRNYYLAHQGDRYDDKPYDSVRAQVFLDYQQEKAETAYSEYINRLAEGERVEFLDYNW